MVNWNFYGKNGLASGTIAEDVCNAENCDFQLELPKSEHLMKIICGK